MPKLNIRIYGDDVLRRKTHYIKKFDDRLAKLVDDMFETMYESGGIGLAAPQVGLSKKLIVVDTQDEGEKIALANPKIVWKSQNCLIMKEGCLSIPGVEGEVVRPDRIKVKGNDPKTGEEIVLEASDLFARVIMHEMDHLNGVLFIDRLDDSERAAIEGQLQEFAAA
ncbi:MAG: peptide deformylase [Candidatus Omnitrophota bacterium]